MPQQFTMRGRLPKLPVALAVTLVVAGCAVGAPGAKVPAHTGPVPLATKLKTVDTLTHTFSLAQNEGLAQATSSLTKNPGLLSALTSLQALASSLAGGSPTSLPAMRASQAYRVNEAAKDATLNATYALAASIESHGATLIYDDATHELTGLRSSDAELAFSFQNHGDTRSWQTTIVHSRDGTTGTFSVEIKAAWVPQPHSLIDSAPPPFQVFGGDYPKTLDSLAVKLDLVPKGDEHLKLHVDGTFDDPQLLGSPALAGMRVPTHWAFSMAVPKAAFDWDSHIKVDLGHSTLTAKGSLSADGQDGMGHFTYSLTGSDADNMAHFAITNSDAKVKLQVDGGLAAPSATVARLISTEDDSELGTVAPDPARPRFAVITLKDGSKKDWELYPASLFPQPALAPAPVFPTPFAPATHTPASASP